MKSIYPKKLQAGDEVRVIAPARALALISSETQEIANANFQKLGLKLSFGDHVNEADEFMSSSVESRIADLHAAFADKNVKAIFTVIGGFNSNQLLSQIDWDLIKKNPKIFCGYSDITALNNSIFAKTGLVTYSGPHYSTLGQKLELEYTLEYLQRCLLSDEPIDVLPSPAWTDDAWYLDQMRRSPIKNDGYWVLQSGEASGRLLGGNLCTLNLLQGTEFMPDLADSVLFIEDDYLAVAHEFDRNLQSLIHLPSFAGVRGIVIGRFQKESKISREALTKIITTKPELAKLPVIANVDFGHSEPKITLPIGGEVEISAKDNHSSIVISKH